MRAGVSNGAAGVLRADPLVAREVARAVSGFGIVLTLRRGDGIFFLGDLRDSGFESVRFSTNVILSCDARRF